ncbi:putative calcium-binding protein CML36 [Cucumis melo var. makuwa]|uniref:Calcium-binding protein CML36 n=1 Tax=Cucumis melo var. makuwa TaxID=1194695 RepID=A0A5A7V530_CUCMM|nr:putative calcium-binding protein CML36 [Cucumis melo var. makuwa]
MEDKSLFLALQKPLSEKEANLVLKMRDANGDGILDKQELMTDLTHTNKKPSTNLPNMKLTREEIKEIFVGFDIDGDGFLSKNEVMQAFGMMGSYSPLLKTHYAMACADEDGDGLISECELNKLIDYVQRTNNRRRLN